jgi:hypothetical protein
MEEDQNPKNGRSGTPGLSEIVKEDSRHKGNGTNGRGRSARNSVKHDLFSRELVFTSAAEREEFEQLLQEFWADCDPHGSREMELVFDMVYCRWRKRRLLRWELAELQRQHDRYLPKLRAELEEKFKINLSLALASGSSEMLKHSSHGLSHLLAVLEETAREVQQAGCLTVGAKEQLVRIFGKEDGSVAARCLEICQADSHAEATSPKSKNDLLYILTEEVRRLRLLKDIAVEAEARSMQVRETSLSGIPQETLDRMQRYETCVDRQFMRLLDQLERLQRYRKGDHVPPPVKVGISRED